MSQEAHPIREILINLLMVIDRLVGGDGLQARSFEGTSTLYNSSHLYVRNIDLDASVSHDASGYHSLVVGHIVNDAGNRVPVKIGMHVLMCWLRRGDAPHGLQSPVVLHDPLHCKRSGCLGLECLTWGDRLDIVRNRHRAVVYKKALLARLGVQQARASECPCNLQLCTCHYMHM